MGQNQKSVDRSGRLGRGRWADLEGDVVAVAVVVDEGEVPVLAHVLVDVHDGRDDVRVPRVHVLPQPRPVVVLVRVEW